MGNQCGTKNCVANNDVVVKSSVQGRQDRLSKRLITISDKSVENNDEGSVKSKFTCPPNFETQGSISIKNMSNLYEDYIFNQTDFSLQQLFQYELQKSSKNINATKIEENYPKIDYKIEKIQCFSDIDSVQSDCETKLCKSNKKNCTCSTCGNSEC